MKRISLKEAKALARTWAYSMAMASRTKAVELRVQISKEGSKSLVLLGSAGEGVSYRVENNRKSVLLTINIGKAVERYNKLLNQRDTGRLDP